MSTEYEQLDTYRIAFKEHLLKYKSENTAITYEYEIRKIIEYMEEQGLVLNRDTMQAYIDYCSSRKLSAATINKVYRAMRSFARFIKREDIVEELRVVKMQDPKMHAPKSLRRLERKRLVEQSSKDSLRNYAIVTTLLNTGLRVSELVSLDRDDVLIVSDEGELIVRSGKGNKERTVPLNKAVRDVLSEYLESRTDKSNALFYGRKHGRIGVRGVQYVMEDYGIHPHQLRHTFITDLVRKNYDLILVSSLSGHASVDILARYSKPSREDLQSAVEDVYE